MYRPRRLDDGDVAYVKFSEEIFMTLRTLLLANNEKLVGTVLAVSNWRSLDQAQVHHIGEASWYTH